MIWRRKARALGIEVLVEVHSYYRQQVELAKRVDWVYDFALPPLLLHALLQQDVAPLGALGWHPPRERAQCAGYA